MARCLDTPRRGIRSRPCEPSPGGADSAVSRSGHSHDDVSPRGQGSPGEPSLEEVVKLLAVARRFFGFAGTAFRLWKVDEVFRRKEKATLVDAVVEVALVSVIGPGLVWATSKWGERLARQANQSHEELVLLNKLAQQEIAERVRIEAALAEANARLECRVAERTQELTELNEALKLEMTERLRARPHSSSRRSWPRRGAWPPRWRTRSAIPWPASRTRSG